MSRASRKAGHIRERRVQRWFDRVLCAKLLRGMSPELLRDFRERERRTFEFFGTVPFLPVEPRDFEMEIRLRWSPVFKPQLLMRIALPADL